MLVLVLVLKAVNSTSLLDATYTIAGYTYGPLLGLFAFGLITRYLHYTLGYELLILNGFLTFSVTGPEVCREGRPCGVRSSGRGISCALRDCWQAVRQYRFQG